MLCSFGEPWKLSPCTAPRVKQAGDWVQALVGSLQTSSRNGGSGWKPRWKRKNCSELAGGWKRSETLCLCHKCCVCTEHWFCGRSVGSSIACSSFLPTGLKGDFFKSSLIWAPASLLDARKGWDELSWLSMVLIAPRLWVSSQYGPFT